MISLGTYLSASGQTLNTGAYLKESLAVQSGSNGEAALNFLRNTDHNLPWLQELEFRTETHHFKFREQDYLLRLSLNMPAQQRAQREYHQAFIRLEELKAGRDLLPVLDEQYSLIVDFHFINLLSEAERNYADLYAKKVKVLRRQVASPEFDLMELVNTEEDLYDKQNDILQYEQDLVLMKQKLTEVTGSDTLQTDLLNTDNILARVTGSSDFTFAAEAISQAEQDLLQKDYVRETAAINNPFDFIQAEYGSRGNDPFREEFSVGLALKFPFKGDKKLDLLELQYEQLEESAKTVENKEERLLEIAEIRQNIEFLIARINLLRQQEEESQAGFALGRLREKSDADPLQILNLEEVQTKRNLRILRLNYRIFREYLDWLRLTESMSQLPLRNWLSEEGETL